MIRSIMAFILLGLLFSITTQADPDDDGTERLADKIPKALLKLSETKNSSIMLEFVKRHRTTD